MLNNIVDNLEQCGQHNIVQCCFHQARTGCAFFAVYSQVNADLFTTRESFVNIVIVCEAFTACNVDVLQWLCAKENNEQSGFHFHMTVKLKERHKANK